MSKEGENGYTDWKKQSQVGPHCVMRTAVVWLPSNADCLFMTMGWETSKKYYVTVTAKSRA